MGSGDRALQPSGLVAITFAYSLPSLYLQGLSPILKLTHSAKLVGSRNPPVCTYSTLDCLLGCGWGWGLNTCLCKVNPLGLIYLSLPTPLFMGVLTPREWYTNVCYVKR